MMAFHRYMTRYYARSYQYVAPYLFLLIAIPMVYGSMSSNVLGTYAFSTIWPFLSSIWISFGFLGVEHRTQQLITVLNVGALERYLRLRLCFITCVACIGTTFAIMYPLVFHRFSVPVTRGEFLVAGVTALSVTLLGVSIGVYFDEHWIGKRSYALLGVIFVTVLSLIAQPLTSDLPHYLRWLIWILPPASRELYAVAEWTSIDHTRQILILAWALVYPLILMMVYVKWIGKKLHD